METVEGFTEGLEKEMIHFLKQIPYSRTILSLKGIKEITAAGLIGEISDFQKFNMLSEVMKLAGLDLFEISSGKHQGGDTYPRKVVRLCISSCTLPHLTRFVRVA